MSIRSILQDLQSGAISKAQAMHAIQRIKAMDGATGLLFAAPHWKNAPPAASSTRKSYRVASPVILLEGFPSLIAAEIENRFPGSQSSPLPESGTDAAETFRLISLECFERVQRILKNRPRQNVLLQILAPDHESGRLILGLVGLLKSASMEEPRFSARVLLAPPDATKDQLLDLLESEMQGEPVACMRMEKGRLQILAWEESDSNAHVTSFPYRENGVYLITGGLGRLATHFAEEILAKTTRAKVVLTGRAPLSESIRSRLGSLCPEAGRVEYSQIDLTDLSQVEASIAGLLRAAGSLNGVIHAAGCIRDNFIVKKTREEFNEVLAPKVSGTWNLDLATRNADLDFFALFSSGAAVVGNVGQSDYAAANGFLDQFASLRAGWVAVRQRKGKTLSINWPLWKDGGLKVGAAEERQLRETFGMQALETHIGLDAFARCMDFATDQAVVVSGDLKKLRQLLFSADGERGGKARAEIPTPSAENAAASTVDRIGWTADFFRREFAAILGVAFAELDPLAPLEKYGINSILAMNLTSKLESVFGPLPKTLFFEYQTIRELAVYFAEAHADGLVRLSASQVSPRPPIPVGNGATPAPAIAPVSRQSRGLGRAGQQPARERKVREADPIAIVGLSGRYPEAKDLTEYWENLRQGKDCVTEIPKERWDWKEYYSADRTQPGAHYSKWGGFLSGADEFDPRFFNISIKEAEHIDPQERIFLQHAWAALEDAGYIRSGLRALPEGNGTGGTGDVGVYVGVMYSDYQLFGAGGEDAEGNPLAIGASHASIANRVSYFLDLHGPSISLDTMCSSSLSAIHLACQDLKTGRIAMAIAGGVNLTLHPHKYLVLSGGQFISSHGHCQSFGEGGDGYIPGEGVGAVILKRLSESLRDGDHIYGIIRGSALNHGGKTNGFSVPNPAAQAQVIRMALREAEVNPRYISYTEAHGTGTKLGDPIEIAALTRVFRETTQDTGFCLIGSAKSNIGHCESAAGIAGLTKVLLQMKHRQIAPSLHSQRLNPNIDFPGTPFLVNQTLTDWERPMVDGVEQPRIAALSSFGAGGSNAHLILQEFEAPQREDGPRRAGAPTDSRKKQDDSDAEELVAVPLSARTGEQLKQMAIALSAHLQSMGTSRADEAAELRSLAYTLQIGREAMDKRLAILARSREHLRGLLQRFAAGESEVDGIFQAKQKADRETLALFATDADLRDTIHKWIDERKYPKLLDLWVKGMDLDWRRFHGESTPMKLSLPTYPFARERCWFHGGRPRGTVRGAGMQGAIHPFLHRNTSGFDRQSYTTLFPEAENIAPFACLEMAAAAIRDASGEAQKSIPIHLENILWGQALRVDRNTPVHIELFQSSDTEIEFEIFCAVQGQEHVLCQGKGSLTGKATTQIIDLERLKAEECLIALKGQEQMADANAALGIDPLLVQGALEAFEVQQHGEGPLLYKALESATLFAPAAKESFAWIRFSESRSPVNGSDGMDLDLADAAGQVTASIRGLSCAKKEMDVAPEVGSANPDLSLSRVSLGETVAQPFAAAGAVTASDRSEGITLVTLSDLSSMDGPPQSQTPITLAPASGRSPRIAEGPSGIFTLTLPEHGDDVFDFEFLLRNTLAALEELGANPSVKAVMIVASGNDFPGRGQEARNAMVRQRFGEAMLAFPFPICTVLKGDALGAGFPWAAYSDIPIFSASARYAYTDATDGISPTLADWLFFKARFGNSFAERFLLLPEPVTGTELGQMGLTAAILPAQQMDVFAEALACDLSGKSRESLRLLKQHLIRNWRNAERDAFALTATDIPGPSATDAGDEAVGILSLPIPYERHADGAVLLRTGDFPATLTPAELLAFLREVFTRIAGRGENRSILIKCSSSDFLPGTEEGFPPSLAVGFQELVEACPLPILAMLRAGMQGPGWLLSLLCDDAIWNEQEVYGCGDAATSDLYRIAWTVLCGRFGEEPAKDLLLVREPVSGRRLAAGPAAFGACATAEEILAVALARADMLRVLPLKSVRGWKRAPSLDDPGVVTAGAATVRGEAGDEAAIEIAPAEESPFAEPPLETSVVRVEDLGEGIVLVAMEDRQSKNMFSPRLVGELSMVFSRLNRSPSCRAVILTGSDTFFASGGTKETLLEIQQGDAKFTDSEAFQLALQCRVPVIAAMQGHAIGAGWVLGLMADFVLFSEESRYRSPYMNFGFTPGAGATFVLPAKLGEDLAQEGLYTGREYSGKEIKARSGAIRLVTRDRIMEAAQSLAAKIATLPGERLMALKRLWSRPFQEKLRAYCQLELEMHEKTLVGNAQALQRIQEAFPGSEESHAPGPMLRKAELRKPSHVAQDRNAVIDKLRAFLATELLIGEHEIDEEMEFVELGLDSVTGVTWIRKINQVFGTAIDATKIYSYSTLGKLGRFVAELLESLPSQAAPETPAVPEAAGSRKASPSAATVTPAASFASSLPKLASLRSRWRGERKKSDASGSMKDPIAVIGMAGQFPQARNTEEFWNNIAEGKNCITEIDPERWSLRRHFEAGAPKPGKTYSKWLGALETYDQFDPMFFNISPVEAEIMDPQQRLFLQSSWHAIEDAGYNPQALSGSRCGVFVGCAASDYHRDSKDHELSAHGFTGSATSILAARISYFLNLRGPCLAIETACSSSLVAIANACDSLNAGTCDLALAGGVYVMTGPGLHIKTSQAGMLSPDGRCFSFDQRANGFVPGEAVGVILLKRLSDAQRDGDLVLGTVRGWGVNQDGKTNGITAPNAEAQKQLELDVYERFGIDPSRIQLVEAHGTGTKLGDPIEVEALKECFRVHTRREGFCAIGSVKSNIGHCLTAAGIAGFIKVLLALRHKQLPPSVHFQELNEHINLHGTPFYVNTRLAPWDVPLGEERQAALSSFGFSGTNAHLVIGEGPELKRPEKSASEVRTNREVLVPFSARSLDRLNRKVKDHLEFLAATGASISLSSLAYVLQTGREPMDHRVVFLADSLAQLQERMRTFLEAGDSGAGYFIGDAKRNAKNPDALLRDRATRDAVVEEWIKQGSYAKLAGMWTKGLDFDWNRLHGRVKPAKVRLPVYPFAEERYRLTPSSHANDTLRKQVGPTDGSESAHPLLHRKTGDLLLQGRTPWLSREGSIESSRLGSDHAASQAPVQRIPLPTYPFAKDRCWPDPAGETPVGEDARPWEENGGSSGTESLERLFEKIERQSIGSREAEKLLRELP